MPSWFFHTWVMNHRKYLVGGQTIINVALQPDIVSVAEVIAIGYGTVKKE